MVVPAPKARSWGASARHQLWRRALLPALLLAVLVARSGGAQPTREGHAVALDGAWSFALDPLGVGEPQQWYGADFPVERWDGVRVPHCFSADPRYYLYTGAAWYVKHAAAPVLPSGQRTFVQFDAVFYRAKVWLNGQLLGEHEGGYLPFEFDATAVVRATGENTLVVRVDNTWDTTTLPGARVTTDPHEAALDQLYPWVNYGGITRGARWVVRPPVFVERVRLTADPDLKRGTADLRLEVTLRNASGQPVLPQPPQVEVYRAGKRLPLRFKATPVVRTPAGETSTVRWAAQLRGADVVLWNQDRPVLYQVRVVAGADTLATRFGIRRWQVQGTQVLLNGEAVRMGGANRPVDFPGEGSRDSPAVLEQDLQLMKNAGLELSRLAHFPVSEQLLDWADEHGLLLIGEAGNWQLGAGQLADPLIRAKFAGMFTDMVRRDWNHPCLVAWSVGNEYDSHRPEGLAWTRDMAALSRQLDPSRPVTFASRFVGGAKRPEEEASQYVDFVSANLYGGYAEALDRVHALYPAKPVYVSEFGIRADQVASEADRIAHVAEALAAMRSRPYVVGASLWTFNDYLSRYPGTGANGYRPWGLVTPTRETRALYTMVQKEFAPATLTLAAAPGGVQATVTARSTLPSYPLRGYVLRAGGQRFPLRDLLPGQSQQVIIPSSRPSLRVQLVRPTGFPTVESTF